MFMQQVLQRNGPSCGTVLARATQRAPVVRNLKLHHKQMHNRQSSCLKDLAMKTTTKVVTNTLPEHEKLRIYSTKSNFGGVSLVGLSL